MIYVRRQGIVYQSYLLFYSFLWILQPTKHTFQVDKMKSSPGNIPSGEDIFHIRGLFSVSVRQK